MSTRAVIARSDGNGGWAGRYHHSDGYPSGLGKALWDLYHGRYQGDAAAMCKELIDDHPAGWSSIIDKDWTLPPGWSTDWDAQQPRCYCHGGRRIEDEWTITSQDDPADRVWAYVIDPATHEMSILRETGDTWRHACKVHLDGVELDWEGIESI